ncbi:MAG TPA: IPTL-CTERM sorting domain-containing protein [Verrucomicrobiae bacterium]|nr:IPTL-CTERM sorting domain-containing protein [Verrucomicrobiae bacterium]
MVFRKRFLTWTAGGLLFLFPAGLLGAAFQIGGTAGRKAIDTLTVEDGTVFGKVAGNVDMIIFETDSLASANATRNRIVFEGLNQLDCKFFRIQALETDRVQINATGNRILVSLKLNGLELTSDSSKAGQTFTRNDANQNPSLPACGSASSLSFYGLVVLALLLAGTAVWMFRRRDTKLA